MNITLDLPQMVKVKWKMKEANECLRSGSVLNLCSTTEDSCNTVTPLLLFSPVCFQALSDLIQCGSAVSLSHLCVMMNCSGNVGQKHYGVIYCAVKSCLFMSLRTQTNPSVDSNVSAGYRTIEWKTSGLHWQLTTAHLMCVSHNSPTYKNMTKLDHVTCVTWDSNL